MYHYEKVLQASDQSDIVWFVSRACNLRRYSQSASGVQKKTFCFIGAIDVLQGAVVRRPISS